MENKEKLIKLVENIHCPEWINDLIEILKHHEEEIENSPNKKCIYHEMDEQTKLELGELNIFDEFGDEHEY